MYETYSIKKTLKKYGLNPLKKFGQNFLIDSNITKKIAKFSYEQSLKLNECKKNKIIEIGPGLGSLTSELIKYFDYVSLIEIDKGFIKILEDFLLPNEKLEIINQDVLKFDFKSFFKQNVNYNLNVCSNLPYYITTSVITLLLENSISKTGEIILNSITLMVQKETADRFLANPGTRTCGAISVFVHFFSEPKRMFDVSRNCFYPIPNVDSTVINFKIINKNFKKIKNKDLFFKIVRAVFCKRRKTILNTLSIFFAIDKNRVIKILNNIEISHLSRAENLLFEDFIKLSDEFSKLDY